MSMGDRRNISMVMDLYELTMSNGYFLESDEGDLATFDVFFRKVPDNGGVYLVPAFTGLGAPNWSRSSNTSRTCTSRRTTSNTSAH